MVLEKIFYCNRDGLKIYAKEYINEENLKHPIIVMSHGFGSSSLEMDAYCKYFAKEGYAAYCFDFCGGSRPGEGKSEGSTLEMTIETECKDLLTVLDEVKSFDYTDETHITLLGASQGGFVSALTAGKRKEEIENLILFFPALCIPDDARRGRLGGSSYDVNNAPDVFHCPGGMNLCRKFYDEVVNMDPYLEISKFKGRVLILQGTSDTMVNYSYSVRAKESYDKGQCHLQLLKGQGHGFSKTVFDGVVTSMSQFLKYKKELMTINVIMTGYEELEKSEDYSKTAVYFTGYCDQENFRGCIMPGAVDIQEQFGDAERVLHADYTLAGMDATGNKCSIHIINQKKDGIFKPEIKTDSTELAYLNSADLTAALECYDGGLTVRIFG